jgi:gamma-glutamyltranspeptidase / glutathione hydrolase
MDIFHSISLVLLTAFCASSFTDARAADRITDAPFATRSEVIAPHAMAATSQPLATQIALDVMKQGGTAVDAAIAADAALGLMEPTGAGIGGDLFAIVWDAKTKRLYGLNASGRSPKSLSYVALKAAVHRQGLEEIPILGPLPVSVPGAVDGWFLLHERLGRLPMPSILSPSIRYAREGFPVSDVIATGWRGNVRSLLKYPGIREQFTRDGEGPAKGQMWTNANLASTYEAIARGGRDAFYKGEIARRIADYMKRQGGYLDYDDLASHRGEWVEPVSVNYRGYDVWELPPQRAGHRGAAGAEYPRRLRSSQVRLRQS